MRLTTKCEGQSTLKGLLIFKNIIRNSNSISEVVVIRFDTIDFGMSGDTVNFGGEFKKSHSDFEPNQAFCPHTKECRYVPELSRTK